MVCLFCDTILDLTSTHLARMQMALTTSGSELSHQIADTLFLSFTALSDAQIGSQSKKGKDTKLWDADCQQK